MSVQARALVEEAVAEAEPLRGRPSIVGIVRAMRAGTRAPARTRLGRFPLRQQTFGCVGAAEPRRQHADRRQGRRLHVISSHDQRNDLADRFASQPLPQRVRLVARKERNRDLVREIAAPAVLRSHLPSRRADRTATHET